MINVEFCLLAMSRADISVIHNIKNIVLFIFGITLRQHTVRISVSKKINYSDMLVIWKIQPFHITTS